MPHFMSTSSSTLPCGILLILLHSFQSLLFIQCNTTVCAGNKSFFSSFQHTLYTFLFAYILIGTYVCMYILACSPVTLLSTTKSNRFYLLTTGFHSPHSHLLQYVDCENIPAFAIKFTEL